VISPLLANIYLHHVLDEWFEGVVRPRLRGRCLLVRYADDAVIAFEDHSSAKRLLDVLGKRLGRYGLQLHPTKTRFVDFRFKRPQGRHPATVGTTFNFLGFTHVWGRSRRGKDVVRQITAKDRYARALASVTEWCRRNLHRPFREQHAHLSRMIRGHCAYYGITGNGDRIRWYHHQLVRIWKKWLRRRGHHRKRRSDPMVSSPARPDMEEMAPAARSSPETAIGSDGIITSSSGYGRNGSGGAVGTAICPGSASEPCSLDIHCLLRRSSTNMLFGERSLRVKNRMREIRSSGSARGGAGRAGAIELAPQLLDLELEMADERFRARQIRLGVGCFGTSNGELGLRLNASGALGKDQRMRGGKIGGERFASGHADDGITSLTIRKPKALSHRRRPPSLLRVSPIDARQQVTQLGRRDRHHAIRRRRP
jgi:hypothetical protein